MTSPWSNIVLPKIRRILPGLIAQEIVGVQPMTMPKDLAILSSSLLIFKRSVVNADGITFKFHPIICRDGTNDTLVIKVLVVSKEVQDDETEICEALMVDIKSLSEGGANIFIEQAISALIDRIDDLTLGESFNNKAATKILEEAKQSFECAEKQENNTTSLQLSMTNEEEYSA